MSASGSSTGAPMTASAAVLLLSASAWIGWVVVVTVVFGVAMGLAGAGNQTALYGQAPAEQLGTASGLLRTFGYIGSRIRAILSGGLGKAVEGMGAGWTRTPHRAHPAAPSG